jgi:predicted PurR-regulated permease PerM
MHSWNRLNGPVGALTAFMLALMLALDESRVSRAFDRRLDRRVGRRWDRRDERGSVTTEHVLWAVAVIAIVGIVVAAVKAYVELQAGKIK